MRYFLACCALCFTTVLSHAADMIWEGEKIIDSKLEIKQQNLLIKPGTKVIFKGNGQLWLQQGNWTAENVTFSAENPVDKQFRIRFSYGKINLKNCTFDNLTAANPERHVQGAIRIQYASGTVENCTFNRSSAIAVLNSRDVTVTGCTFEEGINGVYLFNCQENKVIGNTFIKMSDYGIRLNGAALNQIANNRFETCVLAIQLYGKNTADNKVLGNSIFDGRTGIKVWQTGNGNLISANLFENITSSAIDAGGKGPSGSLIYANNCIYNCGYAIAVPRHTPGTPIIIRDNVICKVRYAFMLSSGEATAEKNLLWQVKNVSHLRNDAKINLKNNINADPKFKDADNGDYRPADGSPLLKAATDGSNIGIFK